MITVDVLMYFAHLSIIICFSLNLYALSSTVQSFIYYDQQCIVCASLDCFSINMFCFCIGLRMCGSVLSRGLRSTRAVLSARRRVTALPDIDNLHDSWVGSHGFTVSRGVVVASPGVIGSRGGRVRILEDGGATW